MVQYDYLKGIGVKCQIAGGSWSRGLTLVSSVRNMDITCSNVYFDLWGNTGSNKNLAEQRDQVFGMIPALANAEFVRYGVMHRNTYLNGPDMLGANYALKGDPMIRFATQAPLEVMPFNELYKFEDTYFLMMDWSDSKEEDVKKLASVMDEYATDIFVGSEKRAFICEHGKVIMKEAAIETLRQI